MNHTKRFLSTAAFAAAFCFLAAPALAQSSGTFNRLDMSLQTGGDDLRGGALVFGQLRFADGRTEPEVNLNRGVGYGGGTTMPINFPLSRAYTLEELRGAQLILRHDGNGREIGQTYDNWDLQRVRLATPRVCTGGEVIANMDYRRLGRIRTSETVAITVPPGRAAETVSTLGFVIVTGEDDLRAGSVATAQFFTVDGRTSPMINLSRGANWRNRTTHTESYPLGASFRLGDLSRLVLSFDGAGRSIGDTYDDWNVSSLQVRMPELCSQRTLLDARGKTFNGGDNTLQVPLSVPMADPVATTQCTAISGSYGPSGSETITLGPDRRTITGRLAGGTRPSFTGTCVNGNVRVSFPDDPSCCTGTFDGRTIRWSNGTSWTKTGR